MNVALSKDNKRLLTCSSCRVTFLDPAPTHEEINRYFTDDYIPNETAIALNFQSRRDSVLSLSFDCIRKRKPGGRVLDIGCAGGYFLNRFFGPKAWERYGVEPSRLAGAMAYQSGITVYQGDVLSVNLPARHFDVITAMDVVCYFREPQLELTALRHSLRQDGLLAIELPLAETQLWRNASPLGQLGGGPARSLTDCGHLFFFNPESLSYVLKESGFAVAEVVPLPAVKQATPSRDLLFRSYFSFSRLAWALSGRTKMLGPNFLVIATLAS